jgi:Flp pilus assembly protein TadD
MRQAYRISGASIALTIALSGCASLPQFGFGKASSGTDAKSDLAKTAELSNAGESGVPSELEIALRQAEAQRKSGDLNAASRTLGQLVLVAPDDARVLGEYGKTLIAKGQSDDALAFLIRAIELQPADWTLYSAQGVAYDQRGNYAAAQVAYGRALILKPGDATVLSNAALSRMQSGDLDGAEALLLQAAQAPGGDHPRIAHNLSLVRDLRAKAAPATPVAAAPAAAAPKASASTPAPAAPAVAAAPVVPSAETIQVTEITGTAKQSEAQTDGAAPQTSAVAQKAVQPALRGVATAQPDQAPKTPKPAPRKAAPAKTAALQPAKPGEQKVAAKPSEVLRRLSPTD